MRIISGKWRSRKLAWPDTGRTRPITDRVRESLFSALGTRYGTPNELPPLRVADVFAGGGSLGFEALSRGAAQACFFERDAEAVACLKRNLNALDAGPEARLVVADLWRHGVHPPEECAPLDLIFLDPPFADARIFTNRGKVGSLLRRLTPGGFAATDALVVFRHERKVRPPAVIGRHWAIEQRREYGVSAITFLTPIPGAAPDPLDQVRNARDDADV